MEDITQGVQLTPLDARRIRRRLKQLGKTQAQVARETSIYPSHLSNILYGERRVSIGKLRTIARACGMTVDVDLTITWRNK